MSLTHAPVLELVLLGLGIVWLVLALMGAVSIARSSESASPLTVSMKLLAGATIFLAIVVVIVMRSPATDESVSNPTATGFSGGRTCASVSAGMSSAEVKALLGEPGEVVDAEDVRGPGAERWVYGGDRCRIHFIDGSVTFVE